MKEFFVYTAMRLGLFIGTFGIVFGVWWLVADSVNIFWAALLSFVISGVASFKVLQHQRGAFAAKVEDRANRAAEKFEAAKAKEDEPEG